MTGATGQRYKQRQLLESTVQIDVFGDRQWDIRNLSTFGRREYQQTGVGFRTGDNLITASHVLIGSHEAAVNPRLIRATTYAGKRANINPATATFRTRSDLAAIDSPNIQGLRSLDIDTGPVRTLTGIDQQTGVLAQQILRQGQDTLQATSYRSIEGASGMGLLGERGVAGVYLGEIGDQGIITRGETIKALLQGSDQTLTGTGADTLRQQLVTEGLHYQAARMAQGQNIFRLHAAGIGTGKIDARHVFKFFEPLERQGILGRTQTAEDFTTREAVDLLKQYYPKARTVSEAIQLTNETKGVFFRAQDPAGIGQHRSHDLTLSNILQTQHQNLRKRYLETLQAEAPDAIVSTDLNIYRQGVFAAGNIDHAYHYLRGNEVHTVNQQAFKEGGSLLHIFEGKTLPGSMSSDPILGEFVVQPTREIYRVHKDHLQFQRDMYIDSKPYPINYTEPALLDAPAELFAVDPRRRYLQQDRPLRLHSGRRKGLRFIREPGKFWDETNKPSLTELQEISEAPLEATRTGSYWSLKGIYSGRNMPDQQTYHYTIDEQLTIPISKMSNYNIWARSQDTFENELGWSNWLTVDRDFIAQQVRNKRELDRNTAGLQQRAQAAYYQSEDYLQSRSYLAGQLKAIRELHTPTERPPLISQAYSEFHKTNTFAIEQQISDIQNASLYEYFIEDPPLHLHSGRVKNIFRKLDDSFMRAFDRFEDFAFPTFIKAERAIGKLPNKVRRIFRGYDTIQDVLDKGESKKNIFFRAQPKGASVVGHRPVDYALTAALQNATEKTDPTKRQSIIGKLPPDALIETQAAGSWNKFSEYVTRGGLYAGRNVDLPLKYLDPYNSASVGGNELIIFKGKELPKSHLQTAHEAIAEPSQVLYRIPVDELPQKLVNEHLDFEWDPDTTPDFNVDARPYRIDPTLPLHLHGRRGRPPRGRRTLYHATPASNIESIIAHGLDPSRAQGRRRETYLHTPARREWAIEHTMEKHGISREDVAYFEVDVNRRDLTRRWRGIWSTPEHIKDPRLLKLHGKRHTLAPDSPFSWRTLGERLNPTVTLYKDISRRTPEINEAIDDMTYTPSFEDLEQYSQLQFFDDPVPPSSAPDQPLMLPPPRQDPTPSQWEAIRHVSGKGVVFAGPGSGKTQTLIGRMHYLKEQGIARPDDVLTLVFGREAAVDMRRRAGDAWNISTIHAFARRIVRDNYETLGYKQRPDITTQTFAQWLPTAAEQISQPLTPTRISQWSQQYESLRSTFLSGKEDYSSLAEPLREAVTMFRQEKLRENRFDFTDAILQASYTLEQHPSVRRRLQERYPFLQIDEFQDVSQQQWRLVSQLTNERNSLWAVGDLDQSIMSFTGGTGEVMREMIRGGASLYNIAENFRSTAPIVEAAQSFIQRDPTRIPVPQTAVRREGDPVNIIRTTDHQATDLQLLADQIGRGRETAILTRTLRERDALQDRISGILRKRGWSTGELANIHYSTAHAAKGKQWQDVILPINLLDDKYGGKDRTFPSRHAKTPEALLEEERLFYVGLTRPQDRLTIMGQETHPYMQPFTGMTEAPPTYFDDIAPPPAPTPAPMPATPLPQPGFQRSDRAFLGETPRPTRDVVPTPDLPPDEHILTPPDDPIPTPRKPILSIGRWGQWMRDRGWAEPLQQITDIAQNAAVINAAAELTWETMMAIHGHPFNPGGMIRAGAEAGVAIGITQLNKRLGARGRMPDPVPDIDELPINAPTAESAAHLQEIFRQASTGRYNQASLQKALAQYDDQQLASMFGEQTAVKLQNIAANTQRFAQRSFQSERNWGETLIGLFTGDIPRKRQYVYDPESQAVNIDTGKPLTLDRMLNNRFTQGWYQRRAFLRQNPEQDRFRRILGPLQEPDVSPSQAYGIFPEARGIARFFGRYKAKPPAEGWRAKTIGDLIPDALAKIGIEGPRNRLDVYMAARKERADLLTARKMDAALYQWQDPQHFYQQTAQALGIEHLEMQPQGKRFSSPYSRFGRHLYKLPPKLKYPILAGAGAGAAYYAGDTIHSMFFEKEEGDFVLRNQHAYSVSKRHPLVKALSSTMPVRRLRARGEKAIDTLLGGEGTFHAEMTKGIVTGTKGRLPKEVKETFLDTGQYHALVQSGMHYNIIGNMLQRFPILGVAAATQVAADIVNPPETHVVHSETPWYEVYKPSPNPWIPRFNPAPHQQPKGFKKPAWAWWPDADSDEVFEYQMRQRGGSQTMETGYLYSIKNPHTNQVYVGLSTRDPAGKGGRIGKHLSGRGSRSIQEALQHYPKSAFETQVYEFSDISYRDLAAQERAVIRQLGENAYNRSAGGEIRIPSIQPQTLKTSQFRFRDAFAYSAYSMFGILPEAIYTHHKQAQKQPPEPEVIDTSVAIPATETVHYPSPTEKPDIGELTDSILTEMDTRGRSLY